MSTDLHELDAWAMRLLSSLSPPARKVLASQIARRLRETSQARVQAQINPDGTPYEKRKPQMRGKAGRVRRKMFTKLRTNRYLKVEASSDGAFVSFAGQAQRIARVHHFGLRDRVEKNGPTVKYAARELLGITDTDQAAIADLVIAHVAG
ncbi:phage virion morphogenesis protein [Pandoraea cepalis]|uniref:Phage virion morphogenesis protein n=1 Tax=Pandoraea cepalis TaxID=2508294 RepID=A0AAW7MJ20_9BURK|nr:phage virion morphogenesis protein [Pandoraea cepalis]MDN4572675.1 phage virion morphogenesis protein [Pandoraea cepalis]MDN4577090.1 phage virion morphogenesis protein [Pandoraea cepalis]